MRKILITGANGFVGCYLLKQLLHKNYTLLASGKGPCRLPFESANLQYQSTDLCSKEEVQTLVNNFQPDVIIHSGAISKPDDCENNREAAWQTNVMGTEYLLQSALPFKSDFIFISTDFVFDGEKGMYTETDHPSPVNFYGQTKLKSEEAVKQYPAIWSIVRTVMVYGLPFHNRQNLVSACAASLAKGEQVTIYEDQIRTPTYVEDLADAIIILMEKRLKGIFHISGNEQMSLYEMIKRVARFLSMNEAMVIPLKEKDRYQEARRPLKTGFNISKAEHELGYHPLSFDKGLEKTFSVASLNPH
jgi:dTDP-4-dehydrorhamnose reductase